MYDSTSLLDCPNDGSIVASYLDGIFAQAASSWNAFTETKVGIVVSAGTNAGQVLDIENGDATPSEAGGWARMRLNAGLSRACLYCNRSNRSAVEANLQANGLNGSQACLWVATLDGTQQVASGPYPVVAVQFANSAMTGGHYDKSIVYDDTWPPPFVFGGVGGSVIGENMTDDELGVFHDLIQFYVWGTVDTSAQSKSDFIFAVKNGTSIASIVSGWMANPQHATWVAQLADSDPSGVTQAQVDSSVQAAIAKLPAPLTLAQVDAEVNAKIAALPAPAPTPVPSLWDVLKATFAAPK